MNGEFDDSVALFVSDSDGPEQYVAFFEDTGESGDLYVSDRLRGEIIFHLQIYTRQAPLDFDESDVRIVWSTNHQKCAVIIFGCFRGVIDMTSGRSIRVSKGSTQITDHEWLEGFEAAGR